uniref:Ribosomal protein S14 n=1 Tax=Panagrolaimus sp. ES5 TaxID=591445 RepID=A0AC34FE83_9BILA
MKLQKSLLKKVVAFYKQEQQTEYREREKNVVNVCIKLALSSAKSYFRQRQFVTFLCNSLSGSSRFSSCGG